tara:strand:+ start:2060 stop:3532 length:1473 start_codon:yes stop_codon:yes gene_type:complete
MPSNLIIPLAGYGRKFVNQGYKTLKPFLPLDQKNKMIDLIINNFPNDTNKIFIVRSDLEKKYLNFLNKVKNCKIYFIKPHNYGPLYTLQAIKDKIIGMKKIYVSYCDINWTWGKSKKLNHNYNYVFCYKGYHPFTEDNNNYAFCKVSKSNILRIKEKESFTKKWQKEPLSVGLFYYNNGKALVESTDAIIKKNIKINNEYFPSLSFNFLKKKKIRLVKNFSHIGKPDYFEIYKKWRHFFLNKNIFLKSIKKYSLADQIIIPAAGLNKRFLSKNIKILKFLIKLEDNKVPMIEFIKKYLKPKKKIILITLKKIKNLEKKFNIITLKKKTKGQADTVYKVLPNILPNKSLFINSCDTFSIFNIKKFNLLKKNSDIIVFLTQNYETDSNTTEGSWAQVAKNDKIKKVILKNKKIKNSLRITGNFYFKDKDIFEKCYSKSKNKLINGEIYIDSMIYYAVRMNLKVSAIIDDTYVNMGTPKLLKEFNYWNKYFNE